MLCGEGCSGLSCPNLQQHSIILSSTHAPAHLLLVDCRYHSGSHPSRTSYTSRHRQIQWLVSIYADHPALGRESPSVVPMLPPHAIQAVQTASEPD